MNEYEKIYELLTSTFQYQGRITSWSHGSTQMPLMNLPAWKKVNIVIHIQNEIWQILILLGVSQMTKNEKKR